MYRRIVTFIALLLFFAPVTQAQERLLTFEDIYDPQKKLDFNGRQPQLFWLADGQHYLQRNDDSARGPVGLVKVEANSGRSEAFHDAARMARALEVIAGLSGQEARQLANLPGFQLNAAQNAVLINHANDLYYYELNTDRAARLTNTPQAAETDETFSPDGRMVGFVRNHNIYMVDIATSQEKALTTDGHRGLLNGRLDWVYEEELYGRGITRSYWWSPDSAEIAFLQLDEKGVPEFTVVDDIPLGQVIELTHYPKSGDPNPKVRLGVVKVSTATPRWIDLSPYQAKEFLIVRVGWTPDSRHIVYEVQNREQSWLDLNLADRQTLATRQLVHEESKAWVEVIDLPHWLADGTFLWESERSGYRHIYHYGADGKLIRALTNGNWNVSAFYGKSDDGWVYFSASERSQLNQDVCRVKLDGSGFTRVSAAEGTHQANFNRQLSLFVDVWSNITTPPQTRLYKSDGAMVRVIEENKIAELGQYRLGKPEFLQVPTQDGFMMEALMIKPPDFDPAKKYPVMVYNYSGPSAPAVRNRWGVPAVQTYMWHQLLAQRGYIVWICDNRLASQKGLSAAFLSYRNLGEFELRDIEAGLSWLKQQPYVDGGRIGLWGWSYGGYMTAYALTHSKSFKIGISGAPVTDWRYYDSIYTERYMGLPQQNPEGYRKSSVVEAAANLHGKLLLIHGTMDDNVHLQNSVQFIDALQRAGKQFDLMLYPKSRHGVVQPHRLKHLRMMMTQFILENL
ncbi:MAG: S9 family peptidase [Acidobacteriota bacterium]